MSSSRSIGIMPPRRNSFTPLAVILCLIMVFFCAVLVFVYVATKSANPVMLDQQGRPLNKSSQQVK